MSNVNLDALLELSLDDLADMPEFKVFPAGAHNCTMKLESKDINGHPAVELKLKHSGEGELSDPNEVMPAAGTEGSVAFMLDNQYGQGEFKEVLKPLAAHYGLSKFGEIKEASENADVVVVTKVRPNKDKTQTYLKIVSLTVV